MSYINDEVILKVKRAAFNHIKNLALNNNAIIYGGFVRDEIISEYYTEKFNKEYEGVSEIYYWDKNISRDTLPRLLIPNDIDMCFYNDNEAKQFIEVIKQDEHFSNVIISNNIANKYYSSAIKTVTTLYVYVCMGKIPFYSQGTNIILQVDIIIPNVQSCPPFGNIDMLCNAFIITKADGKKFSNNTGTEIDNYTYYEKAKIISEILNNLIEFKTHLCFVGDIYKQNSDIANIISMRRILKLHNKQFKWTFLNLPFSTLVEDKLDEISECIICAQEFNKGDHIAINNNALSNNSCKMHYNCLMKYLHHQKVSFNRQNHNTNITYKFKCPYRNDIDFRNCCYNIYR